MHVLGLWGMAPGAGKIPARGGHDSSAVLLRDGRVIAAVEEERLCRVKHTCRPPRQAIALCLREGGITFDDIDLFAIGMRHRRHGRDIATLLSGTPVPPERSVFVDHHVAHAFSAYAFSGFESSLIASIDGMGDGNSGIIAIGEDGRLEQLREFEIQDSLGLFYLRFTKAIGYRLFDEYKVMGLAPYGDSARFRPLIRKLYTLEAEGRYRLFMNRATDVLAAVPPPANDREFGQDHKDLAASAQEALEEIVLHVLTHFASVTGQRRLCLAGGVAHNCSMNGRIAAAGLFERVFVQPAAHDAGTALGAAAAAYAQARRACRVEPIRHVYLGSATATGETLRAELTRWEPWLRITREPDVCRAAAAALATGAVVAWMQGRAEFGPRALGNRSILADPRPAANKDRINAMIKKREAFRPFAPSVLIERAAEFFELPSANDEFSFMTIAVTVHEDKRALLGAITHVNGTARIQTVSRDTNERYWRLIHEFGLITGVPVLLNTSFNNNYEPIVDSLENGINCFLSAGLDYLVIDDYLVQARTPSDSLQLAPSLEGHVTIDEEDGRRHVCRTEDPIHGISDGMVIPLSRQAFRLLREADGQTAWRELGRRCGIECDGALIAELKALWDRRVFSVRPACAPRTR